MWWDDKWNMFLPLWPLKLNCYLSLYLRQNPLNLSSIANHPHAHLIAPYLSMCVSLTPILLYLPLTPTPLSLPQQLILHLPIVLPAPYQFFFPKLNSMLLNIRLLFQCYNFCACFIKRKACMLLRENHAHIFHDTVFLGKKEILISS